MSTNENAVSGHSILIPPNDRNAASTSVRSGGIGYRTANRYKRGKIVKSILRGLSMYIVLSRACD